MRYYKILNTDSSIKLIGTGGAGGIEITKPEYDTLLVEIVAKAERDSEAEQVTMEEQLAQSSEDNIIQSWTDPLE